jgi:hypothetical protein
MWAHLIRLHFPTTCSACGAQLRPDDRAWHDGRSPVVTCGPCGSAALGTVTIDPLRHAADG